MQEMTIHVSFRHELTGSHVIYFPETFGKIGKIVEPYRIHNVGNVAELLFHKLSCPFDADDPDKTGGRLVGKGLDFPV